MKQIIIISISFILLLINSENVFCQYNKTKWLDGSWTGVGYQPTALNKTDWTINLDYNFKTKDIKINYPTFSCGGNWKLVKADKHKAVFIEYITEGANLCLNEETIIVTKIDDNYITISYFLLGKFNGVMAFSTLQKAASKATD